MSPRSSCFLLLSALLAAGCGTSSDVPGNRLGMEVYMSRAVADELGAFQVVVLPSGRSRRCADLQRTCLNQSVKASDPLVIEAADGKTGRALLFPTQLSSAGSQELGVDVPVGRDYVVVIEALSRATPPRFLGSSCNYLEAVNGTRNEPLLAQPITLTSVECDPTFPP
jgi:hypothetical protein